MQGTRSEVGEQQARQPPAQDTADSSLTLTPTWKHPAEGLLAPLPFGQRRRQVQGCGLLPARLAADQGRFPQWPHHHSSAQATLQRLPHTGKDSAVIREVVFSSSWRKGCVSSRRGRDGLGGQRIHSCGKGRELSLQCHTQAVPRNGSSGGSPSAGLTSDPT